MVTEYLSRLGGNDNLPEKQVDLSVSRGLKIYGGHSVRSASTSTAKKAGLSINIILDMADWTSPSTFNLSYYKPTLPVSCGTSVS